VKQRGDASPPASRPWTACRVHPAGGCPPKL